MLRKLQTEREEWAEYNFGGTSSEEMFLGIVEELGELSHSRLKHMQGIRTNENHVEMSKDAVGDIIIFLAGYCSASGFNMEDAVTAAWDEVKQRNWKKFPKNGKNE